MAVHVEARMDRRVLKHASSSVHLFSRAALIALSVVLPGCLGSGGPTPASPTHDAATADQRHGEASSVDSDSPAEADGGCFPYNGPDAVPYVGPLGPARPTLPLPVPGDDIPMDVLGSNTTLLELGSADTGLQINQIGTSLPVSLPLLELGRKVLLSIRMWGRYPNYHWFVWVRDAASRELLLAVHRGNLELFDGPVFRESTALGFGFSVSDICERFDPQYGCTSKGGYLTQLAVDAKVGEDAGSVRISSGEGRKITVGGRDVHLWVGRAMRVQTDDDEGCVDWIPEGVFHVVVR